ncbi:PREDICTED: E3 ubiquitin-protein ligase ZNRF4 [Crocodylus porosus]|uniref:E3 ubiquitin-protein ligase ZNRF4 n=1 Tax=Crocodylus porosus TaxID=8502 RepID=UPI0009404061|nr:PREDICTED: E3 ubiquitin-protein ligase ZNRF4 [Crocodylus porosus]
MWLLQKTPLSVVILLLLIDMAVAEIFVYVVYRYNSTCKDFGALSACLGSPLPREGLRGYLMEAVPANACHPIGGPPPSANSSRAFIALIRRYDCPFSVKILHAQKAGYRAAIIHNVDSEKLVTMVTNVEEIRRQIGIPSVFTGESAAKLLRRVLGSEKVARVTLVVPEYYRNPCWSNNRFSIWDTAQYYWDLQFGYCSKHTLLLFLREFCLVLAVIISTLVIVACMRWCRKNREIKVHQFKSGEKYDPCVICMAEYEEGDRMKILPCSHAYHGTCIDTWLLTQRQNKTCPICKQLVTYNVGI